MRKTFIKLITKLAILVVITTLITSYNKGNLSNHILFSNNKQVAREIEEAIDIMTLKKATNFIKNLPLK